MSLAHCCKWCLSKRSHSNEISGANSSRSVNVIGLVPNILENSLQKEKERNDLNGRITIKNIFISIYIWAPKHFVHLFNIVGPLIRKQDTRYSKCIPARKHLVINTSTFIYLSKAGCSQKTLECHFLFRQIYNF